MPPLTTLDRRVTQAGVALQVCRLALDTGRENIAVVYAGSTALRPELFRSFSRVAIAAADRTIIATLMTSDDPGLVSPNQLGLAEPAFRRLG
jgi:thymidine phosphorylase